MSGVSEVQVLKQDINWEAAFRQLYGQIKLVRNSTAELEDIDFKEYEMMLSPKLIVPAGTEGPIANCNGVFQWFTKTK